MQEAYAFINDYESLLQELMDALDAIRHIEHICKNKGFSCKTSKECQSYIVAQVIGNAYPRQAHLGLKMLEYFRKEEAQLTEDMNICISSDIIESTFWYIQKQEVTEQAVWHNSFCSNDTIISKSRERIRY